ncbi:hypothetical protein [Haloferula sp. BvORR071]|uniref:hypothetical protein n=1 Tax=Haloferula sp. BvORR071 TaxID=1396141 RepID=UPI002240F12C|nr:hypothetical protein [Haloferula sp. BvORR071]
MKTIIPFLLSASMWCMACARAEEAPALTLAILNPLAGESVPAGVIPVSNIKRIDVEFTLDRKIEEDFRESGVLPVNPAQGQNPNEYITIKVSDFASGAPVPVKVSYYGSGGEDGKEAVKYSMEILQPAEVRLGKIQAWATEVLAQQAAIPSEERDQRLNKLDEKRAEIVAAMDKLYFENPLGKFKVIAEYHSKAPAAWVGTTSSQELVVEVKNKGTFFDTLKKP